MKARLKIRQTIPPTITEQQNLLEDEEDIKVHRKESCIQQRYVMVCTAALGYALAYGVRVNLSVAMVAMVNQTFILEHDEDASLNDSCPNLVAENSSSVHINGEFKWSQGLQGIISGSFFYGYLVSQLLGGLLSDKYGGKYILGCGISLSAAMSLLTPPIARINVYIFITLRVIIGFFQGVMYPALISLLASWAPVKERGTLFMIPNLGLYLGIVVTFPLSGWLSEHGFGGGWPSVFYVFGILGCLWLPLWLYLTSNTPETHPRISTYEKEYILKSLKMSNKDSAVKKPIPWKSILMSVRVYSIVIAYFTGAFGYMALLAFLPTYMNEILKFDLMSNSLVSVLPYVSSAVGTLISGYVGDALAIKLNSVTASRKIFNSIATILSAIALMCIPPVGCNRLGVISLLTLSNLLMSFNTVGYLINPIDLAPNFSGSIMGLSNTFGTLGQIMGPLVTGAITNSAQTQETWSLAFYVMASISIFGGIVYLICGTGKLQPWAVTHSDIDIVVNVERDQQTSKSDIDGTSLT